MPNLHPPGWVWLAVTAIALYLLALGALFALQRQILFRPDRSVPDLGRIGQPGLAAMRITTADGLDLLAWQQPWRAEAGGADAPVVLYLHGNGGHMGHRGERLRRFAALGWGVLVVEYRGYGGNPGTPSEAGLRADAAAGLATLIAQGVAPARIVLWGESLGSGLASWLAATQTVGAVVLETPYTSIADIAKQRYWFAPVDLLLRDRFDSLVYMPALRAPVLVAVAGQDRVVPPEMGRALHAAAGGPAELWVAQAAGHTDMVQFGVIEAAAAFLGQHLPR